MSEAIEQEEVVSAHESPALSTAAEAIKQAANAVRRAILATSLNAPHDDAVGLLALMGFMKATLKAESDAVDKFIKEYLMENHCDLVIGHKRWYVGKETKKKCRDVRAAFDAMTVALCGDVAALAECIAADGLKAGACAKVLGDAFAKHWEVTTGDELKLLKVDDDWLARRAEAQERARKAEGVGE